MRWERTSWTKIELEPDERLRYALIAPRLLSPHGNRGVGSEFRPEEALALAVQVRIANLRDYTAQIEEVPSVGEMGASPEWAWRLVGAFLTRVEGDDPGPLMAVAAEAPSLPGRAAASVAAACALHDADQIEEAIRLLNRALAAEGYGRVDTAWLEAQQARLWWEVGHLEDALEVAKRVRDDLVSVRGDATADAINAGAAALISSITGLGSPAEFEAAVVNGDTVAAWWRSQEIVSAGNELAEREFSRWARDTSVNFAREDGVANRLLATEIEATHALDQGGWANRQLAIGRDFLLRLDRHSEAAEAAEGLAALRRSGNAKALRLAVSRLLADGPAEAVRLAAESIDLRRSTHTGALADLTLLEQGGDVLEREVAARLTSELLALAFDPDRFAKRTTPTFDLDMQLAESLGGVIGAAGTASHRELIRRLPDLPRQEPLAARAWAGLLWKIPAQSWSASDARAAAKEAGRHDPTLARALRGVAWRHAGIAEARESLVAEALEGSLFALGELGAVSALPEGEAADLIASIAAGLTEALVRARAGSVSIGGGNYGEALAVLDLWHPKRAEWAPLVELFREDAAPPSMKQRALIVLAGGPESIPRAVRAELRPVVRRLTTARPLRPAPFEGEPDLRGPAVDLAIAIEAIDPRVASGLLGEWLGNEATLRRWAAQTAWRLGGPENVGLLIALAADADPTVRAAGAAALATSLRGEPVVRPAAAAAVERAAADPGVAVPEAVARALAAGGWKGEVAEKLRTELRMNLSASVRLIAAETEQSASEPAGGERHEPGAEAEALDNPYRRQRLDELRDDDGEEAP